MRTRKSAITIHGLLLLSIGSAVSCSPAPPPPTEEVVIIDDLDEPAGEPIPAGDLRDKIISYEFVIYYLPLPTTDPLDELKDLLGQRFTLFEQVEKVTGEETTPVVAAVLDTNPAEAWAPPDANYLHRFGRGLSQEQADAMQACETVLVLHFFYSQDHVWDGLRAAMELTHDLAVATGGLPWDEETREVFTPEAWKERLDGWKDGVPDLTSHTVIHAYKKQEYVRAITLGMAKFGLPDIVVDNFSWSLNRNMGHVVSLLAQSLAEGTAVPRLGEFDLDIRAIQNAAVRDSVIEALEPNATGIALLSLRKGASEEGDPKNRLIEITFDRGAGPDMHAKQDFIVSRAFGWQDEISQVKHDAELEAASQQARTKLPDLFAEFCAGLPPGEYLQVKVPFARPDEGHEWMWVEVVSWDGDAISGLLKNEPFYIPSLHGGQTVDVSAADVFDYIRRHADGTSEGNTTGAIIEQRAK
jgi:uncharacterized protein YegJ (DUF2314 family)